MDEDPTNGCEQGLFSSLFWSRNLMYLCAFTMAFFILSSGAGDGRLDLSVSELFIALRDRAFLRFECLSMITSSGYSIQSLVGGDGAG